MAQKVTPQSDKFITRLNERLDDWLQRYLPSWLYKQVTFQPDRALRPDNNKLAIVYSLLVIAAAIVILILSLQSS